MSARRGTPAFTVIELLVVIAVIALLVGILLPTLASARAQARAVQCVARLQQLGIATTLYLGDFKNALPQVIAPLPSGDTGITGALFGGKRGQVPLYGYDDLGPQRRPLNSYVFADPVPADSEHAAFELEPFRSPADRGAAELYLPLPEYSHTDSLYNLLGSSYVLNDHTLDGESYPTLIPAAGGAMPFVQDPTRTWLLASHTIYNFQQDSDRGERWYHPRDAQANLLFVDGHARMKVPVPDIQCEVENTTRDYTFLCVPEPLRH